MIKTNNFNPIDDPKLICTCGHPECDFRSVTQEVLNNVQLMRNDAKRPFKVTSGGRCSYHDAELGREGTDHQNCIVVDIRFNSKLERNELMVLFGRYGATAVACSEGNTGFVHGAWRELKEGDRRIRTWLY